MLDEKKYGITMVARIVNGNYDCHPKSSFIYDSGHIRDRIQWYLKLYYYWTGKINKDFKVNYCPLA